MLQSLKNIYYLGIKEIRGLLKDWLMLVLIIYSFSYAIAVASKAQPEALTNATIAIVDDDQSQLTKRLADAFIPPMFIPDWQNGTPHSIQRAACLRRCSGVRHS